MAINEADVEKIVKQILTEMGGSSAAAPLCLNRIN